MPYAVNNRARGRVHRVTAATARLPHQQQRVACGWPMKRSTSIVYYARKLTFHPEFCRKCFPPKEVAPRDRTEEVDADGIEDYDERDAREESTTGM